MKTQKLAAILGVAALALGACGGKDKSGGGKGDYTACLVSDSGGWDDKSFNQSAKEGLDKAVKDLGVKSKTAESKTDSDFTRNVEGMVGENCNLVMGVGFKLSDAISASAKDNADINYSLVDSTFKKNLDNERALVFNTHEAAYLAGYAAAANSKTGKVGTFGGVQLPTVTIFMDGFADGVARYNKDKGANVQLIGWDKASQKGLFAETFEDKAKGTQIAEQLIQQGADVIMPVAGPVGQGTLSSVRQKNDAGGTNAVIWVDSDGYTSSGDGSIIMTSVVKEIGNSVFDTVKNASEGRFSSEPYIGTLKNNGVAAAPFHDFDSRVPAPVKARLEELRGQIIDGSLDVSTPYDPS